MLLKGDEERIIVPGFGGYIRKLIDTRTLSKLIAEYLKVTYGALGTSRRYWENKAP